MKLNLKYTCRKCGETNTITGFWQWFWTPHFGSKKYIKCRECSVRNFMERQGWTGPKWLDWPKDWNKK